MSAPDSSGLSPAWIVAGVAAFGLFATWAGKFFGFVSRDEMTRVIEAQDKKFLAAIAELKAASEKATGERHTENRSNFRELFKRLGTVEKTGARLEGVLSGRHRMPPNEDGN